MVCGDHLGCGDPTGCGESMGHPTSCGAPMRRNDQCAAETARAAATQIQGSIWDRVGVRFEADLGFNLRSI